MDTIAFNIPHGITITYDSPYAIEVRDSYKQVNRTNSTEDIVRIENGYCTRTLNGEHESASLSVYASLTHIRLDVSGFFSMMDTVDGKNTFTIRKGMGAETEWD